MAVNYAEKYAAVIDEKFGEESRTEAAINKDYDFTGVNKVNVDRLDPQTKDEVEQMLLSGSTYREIVNYLKSKGVELSRMAVCTYAKKFLATVQMLHIAQENFRMLTDELDRHPGLDTTEAIIQIMSNSILNTLANAQPGLAENQHGQAAPGGKFPGESHSI